MPRSRGRADCTGRSIWAPHQVLEEFWRNRERALVDPLGQIQHIPPWTPRSSVHRQSNNSMWVNRAVVSKSDEAQVEAEINVALANAAALL